MLTKMKELCEQVWCSQLVANHYKTNGNSITYMLKTEGRYMRIADWPHVWCNTPQDCSYWSDIDREWRNNH